MLSCICIFRKEEVHFRLFKGSGERDLPVVNVCVCDASPVLFLYEGCRGAVTVRGPLQQIAMGSGASKRSGQQTTSAPAAVPAASQPTPAKIGESTPAHVISHQNAQDGASKALFIPTGQGPREELNAGAGSGRLSLTEVHTLSSQQSGEGTTSVSDFHDPPPEVIAIHTPDRKSVV